MGCRSRWVVGTEEQDSKLEREIAGLWLKIGLRDIYGMKKQRGIRQKEGCITGDKRIPTPPSFTRNLFRKHHHECDEDGVVNSSIATHTTLGTGQGIGLRFHLVEGRQRLKLSQFLTNIAGNSYHQRPLTSDATHGTVSAGW